MEVVPEDGRALLGPQSDAQMWEDGGAALVDVGLVEEPRRDPVARPQAGERVLLFPLRRKRYAREILEKYIL